LNGDEAEKERETTMTERMAVARARMIAHAGSESTVRSIRRDRPRDATLVRMTPRPTPAPVDDASPASEERASVPSIEARPKLPEAVLRALRNAPPGRPDTEEEKELLAQRRLEPRAAA
jgi:hypothetical protein